MRPLRTLTVFCLLAACLSGSQRARADGSQPAAQSSRCVSASIAGAFVGALVGEGLGIAALTIARGGAPKLDRTDLAWPLVGIAVGATTGPMLSCAIWTPEAHVVPRVSFVIGGAIVGATGAVATTVALAGEEDFNATILMAILAGASGGAAGGFAGSYLHSALFPSGVAPRALRPGYVRGGAALGLGGTF